MFEIGVHYAFDDDLVFGNVVPGRKKYNVFVTQPTNALSDSARTSSANDDVFTQRHVAGGLDLVARLKVMCEE